MDFLKNYLDDQFKNDKKIVIEAVQSGWENNYYLYMNLNTMMKLYS